MIASAADHPGSTGGYSGQLIYYDTMGRVIKQSNPTETSASTANPYSWAATGDDATGNGGTGWVSTQQTYDWKGRPLVTTNTDTTYKSASYGGCGCAGGQVVTLTDEVNRQQKIYSDVLGRQLKTEILNTDLTVYSTTTNTFNARDQVTLVRQYQGADTSTIYQDSTLSYDGYGRLQTKHVPEQQVDPNNPASTDHTTYSYNNDDTVNTITDARAAVTTYGYNGRHLVTSVSNAFSGASTINVTYGYDATGNRTAMSHSVGGMAKDSATYSYDQLSRMTSETRHINALEGYANYGNYSINYGYTVSSELQSVTDPFNSTTTLSYDSTGRTTSVTGSYGGVNYNYATAVQYRAWGAVKAATFGDGDVESVPQFNTRMKPTQFRLTNGSTNVMRYDYSYFNDERLKQLTDLDDQVGDPHVVQFHYMSRQYQYDQAARITAVGTINPSYPNSAPPPFTGNYGHDAFNNMTSRSGHYALNTDETDSATYTKNRRVQTGWSYDADGRVTTSSDTSDSGGSSTQNWTYDAAGELVTTSVVRNSQTTTNNLTYDGDGQLIYESVNGSSDYLIYSSVLGSVMNRLTSTGGKDITYVPTNGLVAPMQNEEPGYSPLLTWVYHDASGLQEGGRAYDPFGSLVQNVQPAVSGGPPGYTPSYGPPYGFNTENSFVNANNLAAGCNIGGAPIDCNRAMIARMGLDFAMDLPGFHLESLYGEASHAANFSQTRRFVRDHPYNPEPLPENPDMPTLVTNIAGEASGHWEITDWGTGLSLDDDPQNTFVSEPQGWHAGVTWTKCPPVQFKISGIGPSQAPNTTAISQTARADIPNGGVAIKPKNFGVKGVNGNNRNVFLNMRFEVDWSTATPTGIPTGIPTEGPYFPVDNIGPASVRNSPGNQIDVYNYQKYDDALASTRTAMVTTWIPSNTAEVKCPE